MPPSVETRLEVLLSVSWELLFLPHRLAFAASTERHQSVVIWGLVSLERKSTNLFLIFRLFSPSINIFPFLFPSCTTLLLQLLFCPLSFLSCVPLLSSPSPELHILPVTVPGFRLLLSSPSPELHILPVTVPGFLLLLSCPSPKMRPPSISEQVLEMRIRIIYIR